MTRFFKTVLLCLLIALLPSTGMTAVRASCHSTDVMNKQVVAVVICQDCQPGPGAKREDLAGVDKNVHVAAAHYCGTCHSGVVALPSQQLPEFIPAAQIAQFSYARDRVDFYPSGLERPPR